MTREERAQLIERLRAENADTLRDMADREARREPEDQPTWQAPVRPAMVREAAAPVARTLTPEEMATWDAWAADRESKLADILGDAIGRVLAHERKAMRAHVEEAIGQLRAEHEVQLLALRRALDEAAPRQVPLPSKPGLKRHAH